MDACIQTLKWLKIFTIILECHASVYDFDAGAKKKYFISRDCFWQAGNPSEQVFNLAWPYRWLENLYKRQLEAQVSLYRSPDLSPFSVKKCLHDESSAEIDSYKES